MPNHLAKSIRRIRSWLRGKSDVRRVEAESAASDEPEVKEPKEKASVDERIRIFQLGFREISDIIKDGAKMEFSNYRHGEIVCKVVGHEIYFTVSEINDVFNGRDPSVMGRAAIRRWARRKVMMSIMAKYANNKQVSDKDSELFHSAYWRDGVWKDSDWKDE